MDEPKDPKLSRKEFAKQMRRAAYERAKEFRATDPKQVAFKEAMKQRRRDANDVAKEQRKEATRVQKAKAREGRGSRAATAGDAPAHDERGDRDERRTALRDEKAAAREQLIALRAQTATAREELVAMRVLAAVAAVDAEAEAPITSLRRVADREAQKQAERTALERRLMMKIVPASKLE
jgi:hypothetical protein